MSNGHPKNGEKQSELGLLMIVLGVDLVWGGNEPVKYGTNRF